MGLLQSKLRILLFTGAGVSTGSGIPDYRGPRGVWKTRTPVTYPEFMSSADARTRYWQQKSEDWGTFRDAEPNDAHRAIVELDGSGKVLCVVTQNVDGLHEKAGIPRARLVEIHGTNRGVECMECHAMFPPDRFYDGYLATKVVPTCEHCGGFLKPAVISFGQALRQTDLQRAADVAASCDLVMSLGSTLSVYPAAGVPLAAAQRGVPYVIVNRGETDHDRLDVVTLRLEGDVGAILKAAVSRALG